MAGKLTINSSGTGELLSGHSWIEYTPDGGETRTYGTWGNNPTGEGNGLFENLELGRVPDASRTTHINDEQEKQLFDKIQEYKDKGDSGWGYLTPCSSFAKDTWETATGENLPDRSAGIISNPSKLKQSILSANGENADVVVPQQRPMSSRRKVDSSIEPCPLSEHAEGDG